MNATTTTVSKSSQKFSCLPAGTLLLAAFIASSMILSAKAQTATSQPDAKPAPASPQNSFNNDELPQPQGEDPLQEKIQEDALLEPRRIAAAVVAADNSSPKMIVEIGAYRGGFLGVFLDKFPHARGQSIEGERAQLAITSSRLTRFGNRVDYKIGCPLRDLTQACTPKNTDVILLEWLSIHQDLDAMYKNYRAAFALLPPGGWVVNLDHAGFGGSAWELWLHSASKGFRPASEGPVIHHPDLRVPTVEEQLGAMTAAGFDAKVVWQSFSTVIFMGRKD